MGLSLEVGILAYLRENEEGYQYFRSQLEIVNKLLQQANVPLHTEPENCDVWSGEMFGYFGSALSSQSGCTSGLNWSAS